jgi:hypothetical protein
MTIHVRSDGKFISAEFIPTKKRFRTLLTKDFLPVEASSIDDLKGARPYRSKESLKRAIRKYKNKY